METDSSYTQPGGSTQRAHLNRATGARSLVAGQLDSSHGFDNGALARALLASKRYPWQVQLVVGASFAQAVDELDGRRRRFLEALAGVRHGGGDLAGIGNVCVSETRVACSQ